MAPQLLTRGGVDGTVASWHGRMLIGSVGYCR
jgi:hypothetical protein